MTTSALAVTAAPQPSITSGQVVDFLIKFCSYSAAAWLLLLPLQSLAVCWAATLTIPLAMLTSKLAHRQQLRMGVVVLISAVAFLLGCSASTVLGGPALFTQRFGSTAVLTMIGVVNFSLWTFAVVFLLRSLTERRPALVATEGLLVVGAAVYYFYGHHESQLDQPRQFSDWALAAGYDPRLVLRLIGVVMMGLVGLLLLRPRGIRHGSSSIALLVLLLVGVYFLSYKVFPDRVRPAKEVATEDEDQKKPNPKPKPPSPKPPEDNSPSFHPHDWPKKPKPMAIATLHDDFAPPGDVYYFREAAYSEFNGQKMIVAQDPAQDADVPRQFPVAKQSFPLPALVEKVQQKVPLTISLIEPHPAPLTLANVQTLEPLPAPMSASFLRSDKMEAQAMSFSLLTVEVAKRGSGDPKWTPEQRAFYTKAPADPRYKELADQIIAENPLPNLRADLRNSPVLQVLTIRRWIEQNTTYWLQAEHHLADDPTASFLFGDRKGFCVHVAHAMVYLSRSLGLPTRLGGGYAISAAQTGKSSGILMTAADRHLWCELYVEGLGWVVVDAALEKSLSPDPPQPDQAVKDFFNEENRPKFDPVPPEERTTVASVVPSILLSLLAAVASLYAVKLWRRYAPHWASTRVLYRVAYRALLDRLAEVGVSRQFGETREEFARRVADWCPEFAEPSSVHVREALTGEPVTDRFTWLGWIRQIDVRIKVTRRLDRRLIGYAHPFSWIAAK